MPSMRTSTELLRSKKRKLLNTAYIGKMPMQRASFLLSFDTAYVDNRPSIVVN